MAGRSDRPAAKASPPLGALHVGRVADADSRRLPDPALRTPFGGVVDRAEPPAPLLTVIEGGSSNSRPSDKSVTPLAAGFDTIRLRFRDQDGAYDQAKGAGAAVQQRGELRRTVGAVTCGAYPDGLVTVEGRLAALLYGEDDHRLLDTDHLARAPEAAAELFDLSLDGPVGVGRADLTSELVFPDAEEGLSLLRAAAAVDLPWLKAGTEGGRAGRLETVYWRSLTGRSVHLRLYDKGVETGTQEPGHWLRLERQRRYRRSREMTVAQLAAGSLRQAFVGRELHALATCADDLHVCDRFHAVERLRELHAAGRLTARGLEQLAGFCLVAGVGLDLRTRQRRSARLRQLGLALAPGVERADTVPVGDYVRSFVHAWAA